MTPNWPTQDRGIDGVLAAIQGGCRRVGLTSPTGGGKGRIMQGIAAPFLDAGERVLLYSNRKLLVEQLTETFAAAGFGPGVIAAGSKADPAALFQVASIQTVAARVLRREKQNRPEAWALPPAALVLVDEAHLMTGQTAREIVRRHVAAGAAVVMVTATPIGLGDMVDELVVAGTNSELRDCGALVLAHHYGPDEPDLKHIGRVNLGDDLTEAQARKAIMTPTIFGRVWEWFNRLNPRRRPTLLFAPGVPESVWFAEQFVANGVTAAHIDGEDVWVNGETRRSDRDARRRVIEGSRDGSIQVVCNRFVLREGIDMPWVEHGIIATVFGSLQSALQSIGRLLRASPKTGKTHATIQDHGGNWHRHGSFNADRVWDLSLSPAAVAGTREDRLRAKVEAEPVRCPQCARILASLRCPCGFVVDPRKKSRPVIQADGSLVQYPGDIYKPRVTREEPDTAALWRKMFHRARNGDMTFRQAEALFFHEHGYWPPRTLPLMPARDRHWYERVNRVGRDDLIGGEQAPAPKPAALAGPSLFGDESLTSRT